MGDLSPQQALVILLVSGVKDIITSRIIPGISSEVRGPADFTGCSGYITGKHDSSNDLNSCIYQICYALSGDSEECTTASIDTLVGNIMEYYDYTVEPQ